MKKLAVLLYAVVMGFALNVYAADGESNAKLKEAGELRGQAVKAQMQADSLLKRAIAIEREIAESEVKSGEKMRGRSPGSYACVSDCLSNRHGDLYTCRRACGAYD